MPLALAAGGGAVAILVAVAWLAWGLGGSGKPGPTSRPTRKSASPATARGPALPRPPAGEPRMSLPLPVTAPDGPAPELDTSDWFSTSPQQPVRVEKGALVLAGAGAVNRQFPNASGPVTVELRAGCDGGGTARILWTEQDAPDFAPQRSVEVALAPDGQWQVLPVALPVVGVLTGLRIDPPEGCPRLELDRIHLQTSAGKTLKEWGFGAYAGKSRKTGWQKN